MNENRTIMVADTKTQKKYKITTNASTLGELKQTLAANGIDYSGMAFTEGITKATLSEDDAPLPTNIPYKGGTTNNLVLLLTNTRKNIASGMDRKEAYALIKENNLQDKVQEIHGRNFTQVPTEALEKILQSYVNQSLAEEPVDERAKAFDKKVTGVVEEVTKPEIDIKATFISLCKALIDSGILTYEDMEEVYDAVCISDSDFDLDSMMAEL